MYNFAIRKYLVASSDEIMECFSGARANIGKVVTSRLDYCNSLLNGLSQTHMLRLQRVQNPAARLICRVKKFDHISTSL